MPTKTESILWIEELPSEQRTGHVISLGSAASKAVPQTVTIFWVMDGAGSALATGVSGDLYIDFDMTLRSATLLADQDGDLVVDIWRDDYGNFPPTVADSITGATSPELDAADSVQDVGLSDWDVDLYAGDVLRFNIDSCTTITRATLALRAVRV
jgi:hypothetical protein